MSSGVPQSTEKSRGKGGRPPLPADQKQVKKTVSTTDPDWEYLSLWWSGDLEQNTPSHHFRELLEDAKSMWPKGPRVFGHEIKRPRHVVPGAKVAKWKHGEGLTPSERKALMIQRFIDEHPEEF